MPVLAVTKERRAGETRVAVTPDALKKLKAMGLDVVVESGAGDGASAPDAAYEAEGAKIVSGLAETLGGADLVFKVRGPTVDEVAALKPGAVVIGLLNPYQDRELLDALAAKGATAFAMEFVPRITRAQVMDTLSSQANLAGYRAVIDGAADYGRALPMMMTAAGTVPATKVFVMGAGVAGLQAIATARRLGAVVQAFDVRPETKEQVESLGAKFVEVPLDTSEAKGTGGYAKEQSEDFLRRQRELMAKVVAASDVVITTAQVPGRKAPVLVTADMVRGMAPGSVIVDMAAGQGGNVELSQPDQDVVVNGVTIDGPTNLPSTVPVHASMTYAKNLTAFLMNMYNGKERVLKIDPDDEIVRESLVARGGEVTNARVRQALGLADPVQEPPPTAPAAAAEPAAAAVPGKEA